MEIGLMEEDSIEQNSSLMDARQEELHLLWGLEQLNQAHMMPKKPNRKLVQCRPLPPEFESPPLNPIDRKLIFTLEFGLDDQYTAVVGRVADKLHMDPARIRLARHICMYNKPFYADIGYPFDCLRSVLERTSADMCDVLYYEVLDDTVPTNPRTVQVSYGGYPNAHKCHIALQPKHIIVEDLLNDVEVVKLTNSNAKLRLVGFCEDTISEVFSPEEEIKNIPEYFTLRIEEIPKMKELGCGGHHVIHVYNITKTDGLPKFHEEECVKPFIFVIHDEETVAEVKVRLRGKLFKNEDFSKWKFGLLRPVGPPVFLEDTDIVSRCFKGKGDLLDNPEKLNFRHPFIIDADTEGTASGKS